MKRVFLLILAVLMLTSCGAKDAGYLADAAFDTEEYLPEYDATCNFSTIFSGFCETEDAYYYTKSAETGTGNFIWYYDKASGVYGKLCARPECTHSDSTCNAYVQSSVNSLSTYGGGLVYYEDSVGQIIFMNYDGTGRSVLNDRGPDYVSGYPYHFFHRGYLYTYREDSKIVNGEVFNTLHVNAKPMGSGEEFEIINTEIDKDICGIIAVPFRNDIYIMMTTLPPESDVGKLNLYRFDTRTRELETLWEGETDCIGLVDDSARFLSDGEKLYIFGESSQAWELMTFDINDREFTITSVPYYCILTYYNGEPVLVHSETKENGAGLTISVMDINLGQIAKTDLDLAALGISGRVSVAGASGGGIICSTGEISNVAYFAVPLDGSEPYLLGDLPTKVLPPIKKGKNN